MISKKVLSMGESATMEFAAKALQLKNEGADLIDLSVGEPDFPTPDYIKKAAVKAIEENKTRYTNNAGISELREAFSLYLKKRWGLNYSRDEILVSTGAKQGIFNAVQTIIDKDEEVIIPLPYYPSHVQMVNFAGGVPVLVDTSEDNSFKITPRAIKKYLSPRTAAIIICNPNNPTGSIYSKKELEDIASLVLENNLFVISDEIYEQLVYDGNDIVSFASLGDEVKKRTIIINGVSKSYSMTGWRLGFSAGPGSIIKGMAKLQSHSTSNANTISQYAALEALTSGQDEIIKMKKEYVLRREFLYSELSRINKLRCTKPEGAFYMFPNISGYLGRGKICSSVDLSLYLLEEAGVVTVPGSGFGMEGYIRISYAASMKNLKEGAARIKGSLAKLD